MTPAGKRALLWLPLAGLLAALAWLAWGWQQDGRHEDGSGVVEAAGEPPGAVPGELPAGAAGADAAPAPPELLRPPPAPRDERPGRARPPDPVFATGRVLADAPLDLATLEVTLLDRDGDDVGSAEVEPDGRFALRHPEALAGGWGLSCDGVRVDVDGARRRLLPAFAGPFEAHSPARPPWDAGELRLRFPPRIVGVVTSARHGRPLEDAEVGFGSSLVAFAFDDDFADTGADGRYALEVSEVPPHGVLVWCRAWEHQAAVVGPFDLPDSGELVLNFHLEKLHALKGSVLDALTGLPVEGAEITLGSSHMVFEDDEDWDFTDAQGRFTLDPEELPLEGAWIHAKGPDGYGPAALRLAGPPGDRVELRLPPLAVLQGVVRDTAGRPLDDAEVLVVFSASWFGLDAGMANDALADEQGAFRVELDLALPEESRLVVEAPGHLSFEAPLLEVARWDPAAGLYVVEVLLEPEAAAAAEADDGGR